MKNPGAFQLAIVTFLLFIFLFFVIFVVRSFAQPVFSTGTDLTSSFGSYMSSIADVNGDGKQDLLVSCFGGTITVFLNTTTPGASTPTFSAKTDFTVGSTIWNCATADFNGDGKPDIAFTTNNGSTVSIFLNTTATGASTPTFSAVTSIASPSNQPFNLAAGDINGDGKPDLVINYTGYSFVTVYLNTTAAGASTPTFSAGTDLAITGGSRSVALKDLNGDGKLDIAAINVTPATVSVFLNTTSAGASTPTFSAKTDFATLADPYSIQIADMNGDGKQDLVVLRHNSSVISILLNTTTTGSSSPTFLAPSVYPAGNIPNVLTVGDLNNDGKPDMIICATDPNLNKIGVYLNTTAPGSASPTFYPLTEFTTNGYPNQCSIADFNGDGKPDLAATTNTFFISILMNSTTMGVSPITCSAKTDFAQSGLMWFNCTADFNGDEKPDVACSNDNGNNTGSIFVNLNSTAPGSSTPSFNAPGILTGFSLLIGICTADFNLDGKQDIAASDYGSFNAAVCLNTTTPGATTPTFSAGTNFYANDFSQIYGIASADFNGDGKPDLAGAILNHNYICVYLNTTTPGSSTPSFTANTTFATGTQPMGICLADFNGDGKIDMAATNQVSNTISVFLNTTVPGSSTPSFTAKTDFATASQPYMIAFGDINGDGKPDLACTNLSGFVSVLLNTTTPGSSTPSFSAHTDLPDGGSNRGICSRDVNGDGRSDLIFCGNNSNGVSVYLNTTTPGAVIPAFSSITTFAAASQPYGVSVADFNGDGKQDFATSNFNGHNMSVILNTSSLPLPVELSSFTATVNNQNVNLNWTTVQEVNNMGFEIERNSFGAGWKKVGYVEGHGTSNNTNNYSFTEHGMNTGTYSYRLKQIDYNGNYEYHDLTNEVIIGIPAKYDLAQNFPNPFNPVSVIGYQIAFKGFVSIKVYDISGKEVAQLVNEVKDPGFYTITFNASSISSGTYFYQINASSPENGKNQNFSKAMKMVVLK